jgi:phosphoribosylglycinamide formyltransferase-1
VHLVTSQLDAGPVLGQARVPVLADDTVQALSARVLVQEHLLYPMVLERFAAGIVDPVWL